MKAQAAEKWEVVMHKNFKKNMRQEFITQSTKDGKLGPQPEEILTCEN